MGYRKRTGFLAGLTVAQISEFSLIFMAMGLSIGHVDEAALGLVTLVGLITIGLSTYMITYSHWLYDWLEPLLGPFEREVPHREDREARVGKWQRFDVLLFGLGRYGMGIARRLRQHGLKVLGVDFNPEVIRSLAEQDMAVVYGDATDPEFIGSLPLGGARWVVSAVPQHQTGVTHDEPRVALIQALRFHGYTGRIAVAAQRATEVERLRAAGADLVFLPFQDAADQAVALMLERASPPSAPCSRSRPRRNSWHEQRLPPMHTRGRDAQPRIDSGKKEASLTAVVHSGAWRGGNEEGPLAPCGGTAGQELS
jgi:voltage-gated potassium channel Kch